MRDVVSDYAKNVARDVKEEHVRKLIGGTGDIPPMVFFERAGAIVATAVAPEVDRDQGLAIAEIGIPGFAADAVTWVADTHMAKTPTNPATGKPWGPNEMQNACDNDGACAVGVLQDALLLVRVERHLGMRTTHLPYDVDKAKRATTWHDVVEFDAKGMDVQGLIPETLREAFAERTTRAALIAQNALPIGLPERQQQSVDAVIVTLLKAGGATVVIRTEAGLTAVGSKS